MAETIGNALFCIFVIGLTLIPLVWGIIICIKETEEKDYQKNRPVIHDSERKTMDKDVYLRATDAESEKEQCASVVEEKKAKALISEEDIRKIDEEYAESLSRIHKKYDEKQAQHTSDCMGIGITFAIVLLLASFWLVDYFVSTFSIDKFTAIFYCCVIYGVLYSAYYIFFVAGIREKLREKCSYEVRVLFEISQMKMARVKSMDIRRIAEVPDGVILNDLELPKTFSGKYTRFVTMTGSFYHKDAHCKGYYLYEKHLFNCISEGYSPCNKCIRDTKDEVIPEWYHKYVELMTIKLKYKAKK